MGKKLLIDFGRLRDFKNVPVEAFCKQDIHATTFKTIRELATFQYTCRRCEKAPCIEACPAEALEKDERGVVRRLVYRCVRCKSCIFSCPFGTMMDNLFEVKISGRKFMYLESESELQEFVKFFPGDVVSIVDGEENPAENIYQLNDIILIKENTWQ
jgi:Fe-S-cluster-containing dehydrogenase component